MPTQKREHARPTYRILLPLILLLLVAPPARAQEGASTAAAALLFPVAFYHHSWSLWLAGDHLVEGLPRRQ